MLAYDSAGRPSALSFDRGLLTYGYSPTTGNLETITAPGGGPGGNTLAYTYDGSLPLSETWSGEVNGSVGVVYDSDFRVVRQVVNGADSLALGYDDDGLLTQAGALTIARRADNGLISGTSLGTLATARGYNGFGELDSLAAAWSGGSLFETHYTRDDLGRITRCRRSPHLALLETPSFAHPALAEFEEFGTLRCDFTRGGHRWPNWEGSRSRWHLKWWRKVRPSGRSRARWA